MFFATFALLVSAGWAGTDQPNWTFHTIHSSSTSVSLRAHIQAYDGLTSPESPDYRVMLDGHATGSKYTAADHASLKTAAGSSGSCTSFDTTMSSTIGSTAWSSLSAAEKADICTIYQHLEGGSDPGLLWWMEVHQQIPGNNSDPQNKRTDTWNKSEVDDMVDDITVNGSGAVTACGTPDIAPLDYTNRLPEELVAICDLLATLK